MSAGGEVFTPILLLVGLGIVLWVVRRVRLTGFNVAAKKHLRVVERMALSPQHSLHLIAFRGKILLISTSQTQCVLLREYSDQCEEPDCFPGL